MRQFPLWVSTDSGPVASVVTVPDEDPRGVVLTLAGAGRHIAIGSTMSALVSEQVAGYGLASVRFDYSGVGDSPGAVREWRLSDVESATGQTLELMKTVSELVGVSQFAVVGTCYGSRVALNLVEHPACLGAVCLAPPVLEHGRVVNLGRSAGHGRRFSFVRGNPMFRKAVYEPLRAVLKETKLAPDVRRALGALDHAELVFLYGESDARDDLNDRAQEVLEKAVAKLPTDQRRRFALDIVSRGALTTFEVLPSNEQADILDLFLPLVNGWFDRAPARTLAPTA
jgi:pimeloyl-ACP methyl ester carboxylesterase